MASRSQPRVFRRTPSAAWLLCAVCGPLGENLAQLAGVSLKGEPGLRFVGRSYEVKDARPFPVLRRMVSEHAELREALEQVEAARCREGAKKRPLNHAEIAGRARAALLLGKGKLFTQHYKTYVQERAFEWHPDPEHLLFWDSVLGPGWEGSACVPEGAAQDDVLRLAASAFAFCSPPAETARGRGVCGAPEGREWLEVAAALREADAEALSRLLADDSDAAAAAAGMLRGSPAEAMPLFARLLGRSCDRRYYLVRLNGVPLLIYALVNGVLAAGSPSFLRVWFSMARYALPLIFPLSMEKEEQELMSFLDHLELVDDLVNRNGLRSELPPLSGGLACLPWALCHAALPCYLRSQLRADMLAEGVLELERRGVLLLARYGAAGLRAAEGLSAELQARMQKLRDDWGCSPPPRLKPRGERAHEALLAAMQKDLRQGSSLRLGEYAQPPQLLASCVSGGVLIRMMRREEQGEYDDSATLRCMNKYASCGQLMLEGASPAEYTRLFAAMQVQVEIVGSLARAGEVTEPPDPRAVLLLSHEGKECFLVALRLRLLPEASPLMVPACGLDVPVLERVDGSSVAVRRDAAREWAEVEKAADSLQQAGCAFAERLVQGVVALSGFAELVPLLRACRECGIECCWEKGHALRLHQPQSGLTLRRENAGGDWLELGGGLPVDEGRVLELATMLDAFAGRSENTLRLAGGEYVLLTPVLERQLALLELVWQEKRGRQGVSSSALPLLDALEGSGQTAEVTSAPAPLPEGLCATLRPYQAEGFRWLAERSGMGLGALLADDMGLGKTVQVLALLLHAAVQPGAGASLVVAPVSLLGNWAEEAARFAPSLTIIIYDSRKPDCLSNMGAGTLVLASYGQIVSRQKDFAAMGWDVLVLDEAQNIKNPDSQRARAVCTLRARSRLCLTGTPVENNLLDLWSQMRFLNPGLLGNRAAFLRRFRNVSPAQLTLLRQVLAPLLLRRTKAEVLTQLPPLTESIEWVEFSKEERALYESLRRSALRKLEGGSKGIGILAELTRLRRACCHGRLAFPEFAGSSAKLVAMAERVQELRTAGRRVLIFSQFTDVLDLAQELLESSGISCLRLDGSTATAERNRLVKCFQEGRADAFLISLKAGGAGLNLTAADYVMLLDPWWNPAVEAQAAGRSHRMGQTQPVTLCRFMVRGTVEERILELHKEKQQLAEQVLSGSGEALSLANLRALLGRDELRERR